MKDYHLKRILGREVDLLVHTKGQVLCWEFYILHLIYASSHHYEIVFTVLQVKILKKIN